MRIYLLEVKRVLKSRRSIILLLIALAMSAIMAWLPVMYEDINQFDQNGNKVAELNGLDAITYKKSLRSANNGEVTPEKLKKALTIYQSAVQPYGEESIYSGEFPTEIYIQKVFPVEFLLGKLPEAFSDPKTGQGKSLMEISPEKLDGFYEQTVQHLEDIMQMEQKGHLAAQEQSLQKYTEVKRLFSFIPAIQETLLIILSFSFFSLSFYVLPPLHLRFQMNIKRVQIVFCAAQSMGVPAWQL